MTELLLIPKNKTDKGFITYLPDFLPDVEKKKIKEKVIVPHVVIRYLGNERILEKFSNIKIENEVVSRYNYKFIAKQMITFNAFIRQLPYVVRNEVIKMNTKILHTIKDIDELKGMDSKFPYKVYENHSNLGSIKKLYGFGIRIGGYVPNKSGYVIDHNLKKGEYILIDLRVTTNLKKHDYIDFVSTRQYPNINMINRDKATEIESIMNNQGSIYRNIYSPIIKLINNENSNSVTEIYDEFIEKVTLETTDPYKSENYRREGVNFTWTGFLAHVEGEVKIMNMDFIVLRIITPLIVNNEFITSIKYGIKFKQMEDKKIENVIKKLKNIKDFEEIKKSNILNEIDAIIIVLPEHVKSNFLRESNGRTIIYTKTKYINKIKLPSTMSYRGRLRDDVHVHQRILMEEYVQYPFPYTTGLKIKEENEGVTTIINIEPTYSIMDALHHNLTHNIPFYDYLTKEILDRILPSENKRLVLRIAYKHYSSEVFSERYDVFFDKDNNVFEIITFMQ